MKNVTKVVIVHLSTVHPRTDSRIFIKEAQTLAHCFPHKVVLMVADGKGSVDSDEGEVSVCDLGRIWGNRLCRMVIGPWRAFFALRKLKPLIIHFHDPELVPLGIVLRVFGHKVVYDVHEDVPSDMLAKSWIPSLIRRSVAWAMAFVERIAGQLLSAVVVATPKIAEHFPNSKTIIVHNYPIKDELILPSVVPYCDRLNVFVYAGVIARNRGIVEIVRAFECNDLCEAKLDLAGAVSSEEFLDTLKALPGWRSVNFHGQVSRRKVADLLGHARAGLVLHHPIPNEINAKPIKLFEFMATGLPVIASDFPPLRKIIESADCGLLVEPLNSAAIAEAMRWILDHPSEAEMMGLRGQRMVGKEFNWENESLKLLSLYDKLLGEGTGELVGSEK